MYIPKLQIDMLPTSNCFSVALQHSTYTNNASNINIDNDDNYNVSLNKDERCLCTRQLCMIKLFCLARHENA